MEDKRVYIFKFKEAQTKLRELLKGTFLTGLDPNEQSMIFMNDPPLKGRLLLRLEDLLKMELDQATDEDVIDTLDSALVYVQRMRIATEQLRTAESMTVPSRYEPTPPELPPYPDFPPPEYPTAPPSEPPMYPYLPRPSPVVPSVLPTPTAFVPPVERTRSRYFFALSVPANASQEQKAAAQQFVDELERLAVLVETHGERFPGLAQVLEPILDKVKPPVKYYGAGFMAIRNFLNGRISEVFTTPASEVQEERLGTLNALIGQVHTIMLCYYRIRRLFNISTVEEDEAKAKAQGQTPSKGWSLFGDEISDDNQ